MHTLDGVSGGFGGGGPAGWGGPSEGAGGELLDFPAGVLFEPVVVAALGSAVAQAGPAACFVGGVVLEVGLGGGPPAGGAGTGGVPDLGQVPELAAGVVPGGLEAVVAGADRDRVERDDQVRLPGPGAQPPAAVAAGRPVRPGRREGELWFVLAGPGGRVRRAGWGVVAVGGPGF